jgi:hypothetical protein
VRIGQGFPKPGELDVQAVLELSMAVAHSQVLNILLEYDVSR